jgi:hypothetical protein
VKKRIFAWVLLVGFIALIINIAFFRFYIEFSFAIYFVIIIYYLVNAKRMV